jgi:hypothetical protein
MTVTQPQSPTATLTTVAWLLRSGVLSTLPSPRPLRGSSSSPPLPLPALDPEAPDRRNRCPGLDQQIQGGKPPGAGERAPQAPPSPGLGRHRCLRPRSAQTAPALRDRQTEGWPGWRTRRWRHGQPGPAEPRRLRGPGRGGASGRLICIIQWGGDSRCLINIQGRGMLA